MKAFPICALISAGLILGGCYSLQTASSQRFGGYKITGTEGKFVEHVHVSNYGWYLFNKYPLICGNANHDSWWGSVLFTDHVTPEIVQGRLTERARRIDAQVADLHYTYNATCMLPIPYVNTTFGILWYKEMQTSGVIVKPSVRAGYSKKSRVINPLNNDLEKLLKSIPDGDAK